MKTIAYALSFAAAAAMAAAPLAAQTSNGPWWDPGRTQAQTTGGNVYGNNGRVYGNNGRIYGQQTVQADGQWRAYSRDRNGNTIYMRTRYDNYGNLIQEYATRNIIGRYNVISSQVIGANGNNGYGVYGNQGVYGNRGSYDRNAEIRREQQIREQEIRQEEARQREIYKQEQHNRDAEIRRENEIRRDEVKNDRAYQKEQEKLRHYDAKRDKDDKHHGHDH